MIRIGIIGFGFVGKAIHKVFEHNAEFSIVDPKYSELKIADIVEKTDIIFICLPAPTLEDNTVDNSTISHVFRQLENLKYKGVVVLKSTLPPGVVDTYTMHGLRYVYSPEFLREAYWEDDAVNPEIIILSGDYRDIEYIEDVYVKHSHILNKSKVKFRKLDYKEAALAKYAINTFLATKIVFMNQLYQLYTDVYGREPVKESWEYFTNILTDDLRIGQSHMLVPGKDGMFGYGGSCFPKDVKGILGIDKNGRLSLLREADVANTKLRLS